jgi:hypothetical protein
MEELALIQKNALELIEAEANAQIRVFKETQPYRNEQSVVKSETKKSEKAFEASLPPR